MKKEDQTEEIKLRLYNLTLMFVRKLKFRYYKQYTGELEDLAIDFYSQFLTPKSREKGKEETLLDKFDPNITSLEYLVKIAVRNMLIDRSRKDCIPFKSIDHFIDEFGDVITKTFGLTTEDEEVAIDNFEISVELERTLANKFALLKQDVKDNLIAYYNEVRGVISDRFREVFDKFIPIQKVEAKPKKMEELYFDIVVGIDTIKVICQQITSKTVCCFYDGKVLDFNRVTGYGRGKMYKDIYLTKDSVAKILGMGTYQSGLDRFSFEKKYNGSVAMF